MNEKLQGLRRQSMKLPLKPGVYIMKNKSDDIIYIGKAKNLKNRVSQYFGSQNNHSEKVRQMVSNVSNFEYIVTDSEFEALVLECNLIKQSSPKYNILLKDDKGYHYIRISNEDWPRISEEKQVKNDKATYIGPYVSSWAVKKSVDESLKIFMLPNCKKNFNIRNKKNRACLNYYIKQCSAPCIGRISKKDYNSSIKEAIDFLKGGSVESIKKLTNKMNELSEQMKFEQAARIRDKLRSIKKLSSEQKVVSFRVKNQDVIAVAELNGKICFEIFRFKKGNLYDKEEFLLNKTMPLNITRSEFISQYYLMRENIPTQITLDGEIDGKEAIQKLLNEKAKKSVHIVVPKKGEQAKLVLMCQKNAEENLLKSVMTKNREDFYLVELKEYLNLKNKPSYIEAYDISNISGDSNVAGMVVFKDGKPFKSAYKKFEIKSFIGQDDYESMREVIKRRFLRYEKEKNKDVGFGKMPDLVLLDGGRGHVNVVRELLKEMGYKNIPVFGMVKDNKHKTRAIAEDGGEIEISSNKNLFLFITKIQDEVHRFAISYHRKKRTKNMLNSQLKEIKGVGKVRAIALVKRFKTIARIKEATIEELMLVPEINRDVAESIYKFFKS